MLYLTRKKLEIRGHKLCCLILKENKNEKETFMRDDTSHQSV